MLIFYAITGLINAIAGIAMGLFVYLSNKGKNINKKFSLFCLSATIWSLAYFIWQISATKEAALFWSHALMMGAIFIPITFFHFIVVFLNQQRKRRKILIIGYFLSFVFSVTNFTPFFIKDVTAKLFFPYWPNPGVFFHFFLVMFFGYVMYAWYLLLRAHREATVIEKQQIRFILIGSIISFLGGSTNYLLWYNIPMPPVGNTVAVAFLVFIAYAILRHYLFNIKIIATELLIGLTSLVLLAELFLSESIPDLLLKSGIFIIFMYLGISLIRSSLEEIKKREKFEQLTIQLKSANVELRRLDQAKTEFLSIASHQLRTPLTAIRGYLSMIEEGDYGSVPKEVKETIKKIYQASTRLVGLTNSLLNVTRIETGKMSFNPSLVSFSDLVSSVIQELEPEAKQKHLFLKYKKTKKKIGKIEIDKEKIRQILLNILDNAIKYTFKGGITITLKVIEANQKLQLKIEDTGEGMSASEIDKIFRSFSRGAAGFQFYSAGAGLGLYVARRFVNLHPGGKVWAESPGKGKGSTFYLELPIKVEKKRA